MRDVTKDELEEYLRFTETHSPDKSFNCQQSQMIGDVIAASNVFPSAAAKTLACIAEGAGAADVMLTLWVMAFQMGREFESRLLTQTLKKSPFVGKA